MKTLDYIKLNDSGVNNVVASLQQLQIRLTIRRRDADRTKVGKLEIRTVKKSRYCVICARTVNRHRWIRRES